jgi:hypothetical protein
MKKIFTSVLLFAAAATASFAGTPQKNLPRLLPEPALDCIKANNYVEAPQGEAVAAVADNTADNDTWTSLGVGEFVDIAVSYMHGAYEGPWQVEIQQSNEHPGYYRLVNPYGSLWPYYNSGKYSVRSEDTYLTINATDSTAVKLVTTTSVKSGTTTYNYTPLNVKIGSAAGELGIRDVATSSTGYGRRFNGNIIFPFNTVAVYSTGYGRSYTQYTELSIKLPDALDHSIAIETLPADSVGYIHQGNAFKYKATLGANSSTFKYKSYVNTGRYGASGGNVKAATAAGSTLKDTVWYTADFSNYSDGYWATMFFTTYGTGNVPFNDAVEHAFIAKHVDSEWRDLGQTDFTDDTYAYVFLNATSTVPASKKVQLYQNKKDPTRFRILNAFATSSLADFDPATMYDGSSTSLNYYTEVVVKRADSVYIPERPMGLTIDGGRLSLTDNGAGKLTDRTISFPNKTLLVSNGYSYYYANYSTAFSLFIPRYDLTVSVSDASNQPVAGAVVTVGDFSATTDDTGLATFSAYGIGTTSATVSAVSADKSLSGSATFDLEDANYDYFVPLTLTQTTGIDKVKADNAGNANAPVYDLNGRRVSSPAQQGVYIKGGKKVVY